MTQLDETRRLEPQTTTLTYRTFDGGLRVEALIGVLETLHTLAHTGMPGELIRKMSYDGQSLTIEVR